MQARISRNCKTSRTRRQQRPTLVSISSSTPTFMSINRGLRFHVHPECYRHSLPLLQIGSHHRHHLSLHLHIRRFHLANDHHHYTSIMSIDITIRLHLGAPHIHTPVRRHSPVVSHRFLHSLQRFVGHPHMINSSPDVENTRFSIVPTIEKSTEIGTSPRFCPTPLQLQE